VPFEDVEVQGRAGIYIPRSPSTGDNHSVEWEQPPGINVYVNAHGAGFTPEELLLVANSLELEAVTRRSSIPIGRVRGEPIAGTMRVNVKGYEPGDGNELLYRNTFTGSCVGFYPGALCVPLIKSHGIAYQFESGIAAGAVPRGTELIRLRFKDGKPFGFAPYELGPTKRTQFFARWLPRRPSGVVQIEALADGRVIACTKVAAAARLADRHSFSC
jgi:hypothetical protein